MVFGQLLANINHATIGTTPKLAQVNYGTTKSVQYIRS